MKTTSVRRRISGSATWLIHRSIPVKSRLILVGILLAFGIGTWVILRAWEQSYQPANYSLIEEGLYQGGDVTAPPHGTQAVLNLCEKEDSYQCPVHVWEPIKDGAPAPSLDWLRQQIKFVAAQRQAGLTTFVHCRNGASRSGLVVVAYLMFQHGWTRDKELAYVRSKRPVTHPNPAFLDLLLEWEKALQS
jgi:hypothetical protein